jgi:hypothetical protein
MTRPSFSGTGFAKLALPATKMVMRYAIVVLVIISMGEATKKILSIIADITQKNEIILFGALAVVLVFAGNILFFSCKAILMSLGKPVGAINRYFRNYRAKKSRCEEAHDQIGSPRPARRIVGKR